MAQSRPKKEETKTELETSPLIGIAGEANTTTTAARTKRKGTDRTKSTATAPQTSDDTADGGHARRGRETAATAIAHP